MPEHAGEKTEQATPRRLEEALKKGQFARSPEVQTVFVLCGGLIARGLGMVRQGNMIRVAPMADLEKEREMQIARRAQDAVLQKDFLDSVEKIVLGPERPLLLSRADKRLITVDELRRTQHDAQFVLGARAGADHRQAGRHRPDRRHAGAGQFVPRRARRQRPRHGAQPSRLRRPRRAERPPWTPAPPRTRRRSPPRGPEQPQPHRSR